MSCGLLHVQYSTLNVGTLFLPVFRWLHAGKKNLKTLKAVLLLEQSGIELQ